MQGFRKSVVFAGWRFPSNRALTDYLGLNKTSIFYFRRVRRARAEVMSGERPPPVNAEKVAEPDD